VQLVECEEIERHAEYILIQAAGDCDRIEAAAGENAPAPVAPGKLSVAAGGLSRCRLLAGSMLE